MKPSPKDIEAARKLHALLGFHSLHADEVAQAFAEHRKAALSSACSEVHEALRPLLTPHKISYVLEGVLKMLDGEDA